MTLEVGERVRARARRAGERRRGLRATVRVFQRWSARLGAVALVGLAVVLAVAGVPHSISGFGDVFGNLGRNLLTAAVLATIAWLWLYSWTSARATRRLRDDARRRPQDLFPIRPGVGSAASVVGRDQMVADIAANLRKEFRAGPQLIVGETGAGKTSVLLALAAHFAERDVLPIVLSLRGEEEVELAERAKTRFKEYVDPHLRAEEEADKLWRWMWRRGKIVVLADDLDRSKLAAAPADPYKLGVRLLLDSARRRDLPAVVASRPQGVPPDLPEPPIVLGPLDWGGGEEENVARAVATVLERAGRRGDQDAGALVRQTIEAGDVLANVFYIDVITTLLRTGRLPEPHDEGVHAVRVELLNALCGTLRGDETVPEKVRERREALLRGLECFAAARLVPPPYRAQASATPTADEREWAEALRFGELAGIVEVEDDGSHRFTHDVLHAYFAAARLPFEETTWRHAVHVAPDAARVNLALVLAAARSRDPGFCEAACDALVPEASDAADEQRLLRAAVAAEVARAGNYSGRDDWIAEACMDARGDASVVAKQAALGELKDLTGARALLALWDYAGDAYAVRWMAAERLVDRFPLEGRRSRRAGVKSGREAYAVLDGLIGGALEVAERCRREGIQPDDWDPRILALKHMAWILPSLSSRARETGDAALAKQVDDHLGRLLELEAVPVTREKGLEASIAQGFKAEARMHRSEGVDERVRALLGRGDAFWYSQLNLVHAVALRAKPGDGAIELIEPLTNERQHPFVRAAAAMCKDALERPPAEAEAAISRCVWDDEGVVVSRRPGGLDDAAIQLVGDIVVLLDLNETGSPAQREDFAKRNKLPYCMGQSRTRMELFDESLGCHPSCPFHLCPYRPAASRMSAHREISRPFCLHQRLNARRATAAGWKSQVRQGALSDFWRRVDSIGGG